MYANAKTKRGLIYAAPGNRDKVHTHEERAKVEQAGSVQSGLANTTPMCPTSLMDEDYGIVGPYWESSTND